MFAGKTISVFSPSNPGGSYHLYCEGVARHLGKHLPGNPTVILQAKPGGGGSVLAAYIANVAPKNGTMIAMISPGTITNAAVHRLKFKPAEFNWLGSVASRAQLMAVWHTAPVSSLDDLKTKQITAAASGKSDATYLLPALLNDLFGTRIKIISGYGGGGEMNAAMERGEVDSRGNYYSGFASIRPDWIRDNKIKFLVALGPKVPQLPNVANFHDLVKPGSIEAKMVAVTELNFVVGQAFYTSPGVPTPVVAAMQKAFSDMLASPELGPYYVSRKLDFSPIDAKEINEVIARGEAASEPAVLARLRRVLGVR
jgi:tripartite-type tricarboxylate transporter receptor subunit TctC